MKFINYSKRTVLFLLVSVLLLSASACSSENASENSSEDLSSLDSTSIETSSLEASDSIESTESDESDNYFSEAPYLSPDEIENFPEEKIDVSVMDDGEFFIKVQTINGNEVCIREMAKKGDDMYANVSIKDNFKWYYSNGATTLTFDDEKKLYEIYSLSPLEVDFDLDGEILENGSCTFFNVKSKYVKYAVDENTSVLHFFRETDGSWLGFQYMYKEQYEEVNIVLEASDSYPSHVVFAIPDDYKYYFEDGENEISIYWGE